MERRDEAKVATVCFALEDEAVAECPFERVGRNSDRLRFLGAMRLGNTRELGDKWIHATSSTPPAEPPHQGRVRTTDTLIVTIGTGKNLFYWGHPCEDV
jgi:hypothetical protein